MKSCSLIHALIFGFFGLSVAITGCTTPTPPKPQPPIAETQTPSRVEKTPEGKSAERRSAQDDKNAEKQNEPTPKTPEYSSTQTNHQADTSSAESPTTAESDAEVNMETSVPESTRTEDIEKTHEQKDFRPASRAASSTTQTGSGSPSQPSDAQPPTSESPAGSSYSPLKPLSVKTEDEKTGDLEQKLDESLSAFDGRLLREKKVLDEQRRESGLAGDALGTGAEEEMGTAGREDADSAAHSEGGSASEAGRMPSPGSPTERERRAGRASSPSPTPPDIPDARDDDIVARQLREAAENEKDPALREKLWEEYRKYKSGKGS